MADEGQQLTRPFQRITDWQRTGAFVLGTLGALMGREGETIHDVAETLHLASLPLLEKSVRDLMRSLARGGRSQGFGELILRQRGNLPAGQPTLGIAAVTRMM